jgi:hypothetical protein
MYLLSQHAYWWRGPPLNLTDVAASIQWMCCMCFNVLNEQT